MFDEASTNSLYSHSEAAARAGWLMLNWLAEVKQSDKAVTVDDITKLSVTLLQPMEEWEQGSQMGGC